MSAERFENASGDFCCVQYNIHQFTNVASIKQVYDAFISYLFNVEISVSEHLGDITTRDDFDYLENSFGRFRFISTEFGVPVEKHGVLFMEYFDSHELFGGQPCGVVAIDRVEKDELYPYAPFDRVRKDASLVIVLQPHWRNDKELVVSMTMGMFIKLHRSECPLATPDIVAKIRENVMGWGDVMIRAMRDILDLKPQ